MRAPITGTMLFDFARTQAMANWVGVTPFFGGQILQHIEYASILFEVFCARTRQMCPQIALAGRERTAEQPAGKHSIRRYADA